MQEPVRTLQLWCGEFGSHTWFIDYGARAICFYSRAETEVSNIRLVRLVTLRLGWPVFRWKETFIVRGPNDPPWEE